MSCAIDVTRIRVDNAQHADEWVRANVRLMSRTHQRDRGPNRILSFSPGVSRG